MRILFIEDNPDNLAVARTLGLALSRRYREDTIILSSSSDALELIGETTFDAVCLSIYDQHDGRHFVPDPDIHKRLLKAVRETSPAAHLAAHVLKLDLHTRRLTDSYGIPEDMVFPKGKSIVDITDAFKEQAARSRPSAILVPIADSAGFAHDQIGAVFLYLRESPQPLSALFHTDQRFEQMILDSAKAHGVSADVIPYQRGSFPVNPEGQQKQIDTARQLAEEKGSKLVLPEQIAERLAEQGHVLTDSPVGALLAKPYPWFKPNEKDAGEAKAILDRAAIAARAQMGAAEDKPVKFLFFFGGKSLTDAEADADQKRLGGMVKSIGADDQIAAVRILQRAGLAQGTVIVPVFAQYGNSEELAERIAAFNAVPSSNTFPSSLPEITNLGVDWNLFQQPATILAAASEYYGAAIIGNGSTAHHQALASAEPGEKLTVMLLRPSWSDIPGETRWDAAAQQGLVMLTTAHDPKNFSYAQIMNLIAAAPEQAQRLIRETSLDCIARGYGLLMHNWEIPLIPSRLPPTVSFALDT